MTDTTTELRAALAKLDEDLNWRGPGGRQMGHAVLPRVLAVAVRDVVRLALNEDGGESQTRRRPYP